jgi:hypothetical protein
VDPDRTVMFEIDGPGVSPATLDSVQALELVGAYLHLLRSVAREHGTELEFRGVKIVDKCAAVAVQVDVPLTLVRRAVVDANHYIVDHDSTNRSVDTLTQRVRQSLRRLPETQCAKVIVGKWRRLLRESTDIAQNPSAEEVTSLRGRILRVGGLKPTVRIHSQSEVSDFSLRLMDEDVARSLARYLYAEIDFTARVYRDDDGAIESGELEEFWPLTDDDPVGAWRRWFSENAKPWNDVIDVEAEIRRGRE